MKTQNVFILVCALLSPTLFAQSILVPGTADLWLAGMPDGSTASSDDIAPDESPVLVTGISITSGSAYTFSASGAVSRGDPLPLYGPLGEPNISDHWSGAENGIANITAPLCSFIGVFLGPDMPNLNPAPDALDFSTPASQDYLTLSPELQQPFYIGNGLASLVALHQVMAPPGATRLFIGTMDEYEWSNNEGSFNVNIQVVPEPSIAGLASVCLTGLWFFRKKFHG
jgi:hypothetical protein